MQISWLGVTVKSGDRSLSLLNKFAFSLSSYRHIKKSGNLRILECTGDSDFYSNLDSCGPGDFIVYAYSLLNYPELCYILMIIIYFFLLKLILL